jgi:hypothetical protein
MAAQDHVDPVVDPGAFRKRRFTQFFGWLSSHQFWLVVFTFLLFLATVGLVMATRNLVTDASKTAQRQLRAYVTATGVNIVPNIDEAGRVIGYHAAVVFDNSGSTPTVGLRWSVKPWPEESAERYVCPVPVAEDDYANLNRLLIGPHTKIENVYQMIIDNKTLPKIIGGKMRPQLDRVVYYKDVFGDKHKTRFCFLIYHNPGISGHDGLDFAACGGNFNCADDECDQPPSPVTPIEKCAIP